MSRRSIRALKRLAGFSWIVVRANADFFVHLWLAGRATSLKARAEWLQRWSTRILRCVNVTVSRIGDLPKEGILACNHLSYLDIVVLAAGQPMVFVSKNEVRRWPVIGRLTRFAGTLYIKRDRKSDVARLAEDFAPVVEEGVVLGLFPEGTSTDGHRVLPFHSALFEPAVRGGWRVCPAWIGYTLADGSVEDEVCYWRDMTFVWHFLRLLSKERIDAVVAYGPSLVPGLKRKELARLLHTQVCQLGGQVLQTGELTTEKGRTSRPAEGAAPLRPPAVTPG